MMGHLKLRTHCSIFRFRPFLMMGMLPVHIPPVSIEDALNTIWAFTLLHQKQNGVVNPVRTAHNGPDYDFRGHKSFKA